MEDTVVAAYCLCAEDMDLSLIAIQFWLFRFSIARLDLASMWRGYLAAPLQSPHPERCRRCGNSYEDYKIWQNRQNCQIDKTAVSGVCKIVKGRPSDQENITTQLNHSIRWKFRKEWGNMHII